MTTTITDTLDRIEAALSAAGFVAEQSSVSRSKYWTHPRFEDAACQPKIRTSDHRQGIGGESRVVAEVIVVDDPGRFLLDWDATDEQITAAVAEAVDDYERAF